MPGWQSAPIVDDEPKWMQAQIVDDGPAMRSEGGETDQSALQSKARAQARARASTAPVIGPLMSNPYVPEWAKEKFTGAHAGILSGGTLSTDDEIVGLFAGEDAKNRARNVKDITRHDTPVSSFAGEVFGGAWMPAGGAANATKATGQATIREGLKQGAKYGAGYGAAYGAGEAEGGVQERAKGAVTGGALGAVTGGALGAGGAAIVRKLSGQGGPASQIILEATAQEAGIPRSSIKGLDAILRNGGYSGDDIDRGMRHLVESINTRLQRGERVGLMATELQEAFPAAQQQIKDVFQQLATAPPRQGKTAQILTKALDDQYGSQGKHLEGVAQARLGTNTVGGEQSMLAAERRSIGEIRDKAIKFGATDARGAGLRKQMADRFTQLSDDSEVRSTMRAAARQLGYGKEGGADEITRAMQDNPFLVVQKFNELAGEQLRANRGTPVLQQARNEFENLVDEASRYTRQEGNFMFAPRADGKVGPYKAQQSKFAENYSQADAIKEARGRFSQARDPVKADEFINWYNGLPQGEQNLVKTVVRQDMEKMLRGGKIDQDGAYLTNLRSMGVNDVLKKLFGKDGEDITTAIAQLSKEQDALKNIDPNKGLQERVVRGGPANRARNLYTTSPIARLGDKLPSQAQYMDIGLLASGNLPYMTMAKQASKMFRPRAPTREGIAQILAMHPSRPMKNITPRKAPVGTVSGQGGAAVSRQAQQQNKTLQAAQSQRDQAVARLEAAKQSRASQEQIVALRKEAAIAEGKARAVEAMNRKADALERKALAEAKIAHEGPSREAMLAAQTAEQEAVKAEQQAQAARRVTQERIASIVKVGRKSAKAQKKALKAKGRAEVANAQGIAEGKAAKEYADTMSEASRLQGMGVRRSHGARQVRKQADEGMRQNLDEVMRNTALKDARAGIDPKTIYEETGYLPLLNDGKGGGIVMTPDQVRAAGGYAKLMRDLQKVIRKGKGNNDLAWAAYDALSKNVEKGTLARAAEAGDFPGWSTPGERRAINAFKGITGAAGVGAIGMAGYAKYDDARDTKRQSYYDGPFRADRDAVKALQRALKAVGDYSGRSDGKYDDELNKALINYQYRSGTADGMVGDLDHATLTAIVEDLEQAGRIADAEALKAKLAGNGPKGPGLLERVGSAAKTLLTAN